MGNKIFKPKRSILLCGVILSALIFPDLLTAQRVNISAMTVKATHIWKQELGDLVLGRPYLQAESAVLACAGGSIKSYFMLGTPLWDFDAQEAATPYVARSYEGASYVCSSAGIFKVVNRVGRELWRLNFGKPINYSPVVGWDGRVFIPLDSQVFCRTAAGHPLWSKDLGSPMAMAPILDHAGSFVTVLQNRDLVRLSQFSAEERTRLDQMPSLIISLKTDNHDSYVVVYQNGSAEKITYNGKAARGSRLSRGVFPSMGAVPASAASKGDQFAITFRDGKVQMRDVAGKVLWTGNSHETAEEKGSANIDNSRSYMVFDERGIYTISTRGATGFAPDGRRRFIHKMAEASSLPGFSDEGILYACGKDKVLYTYKLDEKPRTVKRSKYYGPEPEGSYGMGNPPPSPWSTDTRRFHDDQQDIMYKEIEKAINSGQIAEGEPQYVAYLMEMIGFFLNDPHYSRVRPQVKPVQRIDLIRLLGRIGSRETIPFLWNIFDKDDEPAIKAACAEAIGKIGVDPDGGSFYSYNYLLAANNPNRDPQLLLSATSSVAAICRFSGPPLSGEGIMLLRFFSNLPWPPPSVKAQIKNEVEALFKEGLDKVVN